MQVSATLNPYWLLLKDLSANEKLSLIELLVKSLQSAPPELQSKPPSRQTKKSDWAHRFEGSWNDSPETAEQMIEVIARLPNSIVTIDQELMSGIPVFTGTRVPVKSLFDWLETETIEEFLENFPAVKREQALGVLGFAERTLFTHKMAEHETLAG